MNCGELKSLTDAYVDGELERAQKARVDVHLKECEHCRKRVEGARKAQRLLKEAVVKPQAPETLNMKIRTSIEDLRKRD